MKNEKYDALSAFAVIPQGNSSLFIISSSLIKRSLTGWKTRNLFENQKKNMVLRVDFVAKYKRMRQLAFIKMFLLVSITMDVNDNRRHIHVFRKGGRHLHSVAKIWIERNGFKDIEIAESLLSAKDNAMIVAAIDRHWEFLNEQITRTFNGEKTKVKNIEK